MERHLQGYRHAHNCWLIYKLELAKVIEALAKVKSPLITDIINDYSNPYYTSSPWYWAQCYEMFNRTIRVDVKAIDKECPYVLVDDDLQPMALEKKLWLDLHTSNSAMDGQPSIGYKDLSEETRVYCIILVHITHNEGLANELILPGCNATPGCTWSPYTKWCSCHHYKGFEWKIDEVNWFNEQRSLYHSHPAGYQYMTYPDWSICKEAPDGVNDNEFAFKYKQAYNDQSRLSSLNQG